MNTQTAIQIIQRAWKHFTRTRCPYCDSLHCNGYYSQFDCEAIWEKGDLYRLDREIDGNYW